MNKFNEKNKLLERTRRVVNSIISGLEEVELETRRKIMEKGGEACAVVESLKVAERIGEETTDIEEILTKVNDQIPWCGTWTRKGKIITAICQECGCPLIRNNIVNLTATFCYCSVGWVKRIFEALLKKPVKVELEESIGFGDEVCKFIVFT